MNLLELSEIHKKYSLGETHVHALRGIDMCIRQGEFIAVWGPSGSGKSSLLNIIGLIDDPTSGRVVFNGKDTTNMSDEERAEARSHLIGFMFQSFNLIPVLSALENVMLPLEIQGRNSRDARDMAMQALRDVIMTDFIQHRPDKLSGGQRQRVAIARALVTDAKLIICDEPTANLDSENSQRILDLMIGLNETKGVTFLFSTHDQRLLDRVRRLVRIEDGVIVDDNLRVKLQGLK